MSEIIKESFSSRMLEREIPYRLILPEDYRSNLDGRYPVLYLLHGLFGSCDNFPELTEVFDYARNKNLILVFPEGADGWYTDSSSNERDKFESFFFKEFFPSIEKKYRVVASRSGRGIAGISMGGYGALKFCLRKPFAFAFAASMSGALDAASRKAADSETDWSNLGASLSKAFEKQTEQIRKENDLFCLVAELTQEQIADLPDMCLDCGAEDSFLSVNRRFTGLLKSKNINFEYHEIAGGKHDWDYWNLRLADVIDKAAKILN